jgi:subtilisin family serine protease
MAAVPEPFGHLDLPPRKPAQKKKDRQRNREQTQLLDGTSPTLTTGSPSSRRTSARGTNQDGLDELVKLLMKRRSKAGSKVVELATSPSDSGGRSLVVRGELLVRHDDGGNLADGARGVLDHYKFAEVKQGAGARICPELVGRLTVWLHTGPGTARNRHMRTAMTQLQGQGVQASPHLVTALHAVPPNIVAKAAVGPAPTVVDDDDLQFGKAGRRRPKGRPVVAVIDTGIVQRERHDGWLNDVERKPRRQGEPGNIDPLDAFPPPKNGYLDFAAGHGTFAAGIVRLVDPQAKIKVYRALDSDGFASELDIACAMVRAVREGADVLNLSVGMRTVDDSPSVALELALDLIDEFIAANPKRKAPAIVASAGNYGDSRKVWPAAFTERVVSVAALTARMQRARWSSRGRWVTASCVGEGIVSTFVSGDEDPAFSKHHPKWPLPDHYPLPGQDDAWAVWSGTSFSAPQIAGAISRAMREQGLSPRAAEKWVLDQGTALTNFGQAVCLLPGT